MSDNFNEIQYMAINQATDKLDNLIHALELPLPGQMHADMMLQILPEVRDSIRRSMILITGENPWNKPQRNLLDDY